MKRKTQKEDLIKVLKRKYISNWDAYEMFGCTKLPARVSEFIEQGYHIDKKQMKVTTRYGAKVTITKYKIINTPHNEKTN